MRARSGAGRPRSAAVAGSVCAAWLAAALCCACAAGSAPATCLTPATARAEGVAVQADGESAADEVAGAVALGTDMAGTGVERIATGASLLNGVLGGDRGILPVGLGEDVATFTTIARLAGADGSLNETLVAFRGEVVGEPVDSSLPGYRWVLLQSYAGSTSSIQVLMSDEFIAQFENFGSYKTKGATLLVTGIYRVADPNQMGALDVTAYSVRVQDPGGPIEHDVDLGHLWIGLALVAVGAILCIVNVYLKWRSHS